MNSKRRGVGGAELMEITYLATSIAWLDHTVAGIRRFYQIGGGGGVITEAYLECAASTHTC